MMLLDGRLISDKRLKALRDKVAACDQRPGLAVIRVGDNPASKIYVAKKVSTCKEIGFHSIEKTLPETTSQSTLLDLIAKLNCDSSIHGILVQLPLPKQISEDTIVNAISPEKDVDGFHPLNLGRLISKQDGFIPCTPLGIMTLIDEYKIDLVGKRAVVIGRSRIVGRPMSILLDLAGATVTVAHSQTKDLSAYLKDADIIVAAIGKPEFLKAESLKQGVIVIDVGINRLPDGKIVGDADFRSLSQKASAMTPVPGGVGPMTICSLIENTWKSFQRCRQIETIS